MILHHEVQQVRGLLLHRRIELLPAKSLVDRRDHAVKCTAALPAKQCVIGKLRTHLSDHRASLADRESPTRHGARRCLELARVVVAQQG